MWGAYIFIYNTARKFLFLNLMNKKRGKKGKKKINSRISAHSYIAAHVKKMHSPRRSAHSYVVYVYIYSPCFRACISIIHTESRFVKNFIYFFLFIYFFIYFFIFFFKKRLTICAFMCIIYNRSWKNICFINHIKL